MKIRIQNSEKFFNVEIEHPYLISNPEVFEAKLKPQLQETIDKDDLKCDGCGKSLINRAWVCVNHRPMSARVIKETMRIENKETGEVYGEGEWELKDVWGLFLFCHETQKECFEEWKARRPK